MTPNKTRDDLAAEYSGYDHKAELLGLNQHALDQYVGFKAGWDARGETKKKGSLKAYEAHYLKCFDDNCEEAACVERREKCAEIEKLREENAALREALARIANHNTACADAVNMYLSSGQHTALQKVNDPKR